MSDRQVAVLAVVVWLGALVPVGDEPVLRWALLGAAVAVWKLQRVWWLIAVAGLLASVGAGVAWAGIGTALAGEYSGPVRLATDPAPAPGGQRVTVEIDGERYDVRVWGSAAGHVRPRLMGESIDATVKLRPLGDAPTWLRARGLAGRGTIVEVRGFDVGAPHTRLANSIRRTIESGARSLSRDDQSLFAGLVYGDDRQQSPLTADNFAAAGLTHLLAVSGQNVVFVLAIVGPVLRRVGYRARFGLVLTVLLVFATVTRFEASVVRASVMTAVAAVGALVGTEVSSRRVLTLAVALLVLVDPLIVHSVAFQLSVAASAGILLWSGRVGRLVPGPRPLIDMLAVTASAQLAVAPLLLFYFDGLPVASLPANMLAGPAAGPVMMWGLTGGVAAGLAPEWLASMVHWPTSVALRWIDSVAAGAAGLPLGQLGAAHVIVCFMVGVVGVRTTSARTRVVVLATLFVVLAHPAVVVATEPVQTQRIDDDIVVWRDEQLAMVELGSVNDPEQVLAGLRNANLATIDVLVVRRSSFGNASLVRWLQTRHQIESVWAPEPTMGVGERIPASGTSVVVDGVRLTVEIDGDELLLNAVITDP